MPQAPADSSYPYVGSLAGGGELGALIREFDWKKTPLGPIEAWPESLKTTVSLILNSQHPMWIGWGPEATFLYNDAYISVLGVAKHPWALGRPASQVWAEIWDYAGPLAAKVFEKGEATFADDVRLFMSRGDYLEETYYSFSYSPIRDDRGHVAGLFCPSAEVTARVLNNRRLATMSNLARQALVEKSAASACKTSAAILAQNPDDIPFFLLYLVDDDDKAARLQHVAGLERIDELFAPSSIGLVPGAAPGFWPVPEVLSSGKAVITRLPALDFLPSGLAGQPLKEALVLPVATAPQENPVGALIVGISPARKLDADSQTFFTLVASQIGTAIQNARAAEAEKRRADALAELDRAKTVFFSNVSHELRTPLTLMLGPIEHALQHGAERDDLELAHRNGLRLLRLVNTLLDFSRIEAGRIDASFQPVDLAAMTADLASTFRSAMEGAGLSLLVDCQPIGEPVFVDTAMWEKIVLNLLSNALKFTLEGEVRVKLTDAGDFAELEVTDTGVGIPSAELPRVFERFHRVRGAQGRSHEGTGIGLALVQELAALHGGAATVSSIEGCGSTFRVSIRRGATHLPSERIISAPALRDQATNIQAFIEESLRWLPHGADALHAQHQSIALTASEGKPRILLADDNADMRDYVARLLSPRYAVECVADGEAALKLIKDRRPDLILSDVMMPRLDGFGLLSALRENPETATLPVVLVSARAGEESRIEGLAARANDYLIKPFSARELLATVQAQIELAQLRAEVSDHKRAVRDSEARLDAYFRQQSVGIVQTDLTGRFLKVNDRYCEIVGRSREELLMMRMQDITHPDDLPGNLVSFEALVAGELADYVIEKRYLRPDCSIVWANISVTNVRDATDVMPYVLAVTQDITARKEAQWRQACLVKLHEAIRPLERSADVISTVCAIAGEHYGVNRCSWVEVSEDGFWADIHPDWRTPGTPSIAGRQSLGGAGAIVDDLKAGRPRAVEDCRKDTRGGDEKVQRARESIHARASLAVPLIKHGKFVAAFFLHAREPRKWTAVEFGLAEQIADHRWIMLEALHAQRLLQESRDTFQQMANAAPAMLWVTEPDGNCTFLSRSWYEFTGQNPEDAKGLGWTKAIHPEQQEEAAAAFLAANRGQESFHSDYLARRADGEYRWVLDVGRPRFDQHGNYQGMVGSVFDIHERNLAEAKLVEQAEKLRLADRRKDEFLAMLSHELRNPLASVCNAVALLQSDSSVEDRAWAIDVLQRQSTQLSQLVNDLLDVSRITSGKVRLRKERIDAGSILDAAVRTVSPLIKERGHRLIFEPPQEWEFPLEADATRLEQIVTNLLTNAAKYTPDSGEIYLTISREPTKPDWGGDPKAESIVAIHVRDTGVGIASEKISHMFELFVQGERSIARSEGGLGIGLTIVQRLARLHGGTVTASSRGENRGSEFIVRLPAARAAKRAGADGQALDGLDGPSGHESEDEAILPLPNLAGKPLILVVDDNIDTARTLSRLLRIWGYSTETAHDGPDAVEAARVRKPDCVLLDIGLPSMDGYEVCRMLRQDAAHGTMTVVALTGYGQDDDRLRTKEAGFDAHFVKPLDPGALRETLASILTKAI